MFDWDAIQTELFTRFWKCNFLTKAEAEAHAALAVLVFKRNVNEIEKQS